MPKFLSWYLEFVISIMVLKLSHLSEKDDEGDDENHQNREDFEE
jgi:hypothetical protein